MFRAVLLSSQCFCLVFGRGDGQKVIPRSGVGRPWREIQKEATIISRRKRGMINYLDGSGHKGPADFLQVLLSQLFPPVVGLLQILSYMEVLFLFFALLRFLEPRLILIQAFEY